MGLFGLIPKWVWAAVVAALSATSCKLHWDKNGLMIDLEKSKNTIAQLERDHSIVVATQTSKLLEANARVANAEREIVTSHAELRKVKNEQVASIESTRRAMLAGAGVRFRAPSFLGPVAFDSPTHVIRPPAGPTTPGGGGAELPSAIEALIDEAARADTIRVNLLACYASYDAAKRALDNLSVATPTPPGSAGAVKGSDQPEGTE